MKGMDASDSRPIYIFPNQRKRERVRERESEREREKMRRPKKMREDKKRGEDKRGRGGGVGG